MKEVYIVDAARTAIGSFNGSLAGVEGHVLGQNIISHLVSKNKLAPDDISEVILGQILVAAKKQNPARQATLGAGLAISVPAITINQVCGSGLRAVAMGFQAIRTGDAEIIIAGGQENMSRSCHAFLARTGIKFGNGTLIDTMMSDGLCDAFAGYAMGITAENIAKKYNITRLMQDEFSYYSQMKAAQAQSSGKFKDEIIPLKIISKKEEVIFEKDEFIRAETNLESLARLKPAFDKEGTVTAGNASGINDGAAGLLLMSADAVKKYNLTPIARIVSWAHAGVDPAIMGIGPVDAVKKALSKVNWNVADLDLIEANEAFAAQALAVNQELGWDVSKVNVNGGAIALGHPIGASGARILVTLLHEMRKAKLRKGLATLCVGGGMGVALCVDSLYNL